MISLKLPTLKQEIKDGELKSVKGEMNCFVNVSASAQMIWEREFPILAEKTALFEYVDNFSQTGIKDSASAIFALKLLYCFLVFEKPLSVFDYLSMFNFASVEYFDELTQTLIKAFEVIFPESKKKV